MVQSTTPSSLPVDGAELLRDIKGRILRHAVMTDAEATAAALFVVFTFAHDAFQISPLLAVVSPEKRCGKTTVLGVISKLAKNALGASNLTPAVIYRSIGVYEPTLIIDEADTFLDSRNDLIGILNSGQSRAMASVARSRADTFEPEFYSTWCPKVLAKIGNLPSTLDDRSITIFLRRKLAGEIVAKVMPDDEKEMGVLRGKAMRWAQDHLEVLRRHEPNPPTELHDRAADNWTPLLSIADFAGHEWPSLAREAAVRLSAGREVHDDSNAKLLEGVREVILSDDGGVITSKRLLDGLLSLEESPWADLSGRGLSGNGLAARLRTFNIRPKSLWLGGRSVKGYEVSAFEDAFRRYLPPRENGEDGEAGPETEALTTLTAQAGG